MKNGKNWIGMLVFVLVFGMAAIGCDKDPEPSWQASNIPPFGGTVATDWTTMTFTYEGSEVTLTKTSGNSGSLDGTWTGIVQGISVVVTFSGGNWTTKDIAGNNLAKGTVIVNGTNLTITITHMWDTGSSVGKAKDGSPPPGIENIHQRTYHVYGYKSHSSDSIKTWAEIITDSHPDWVEIKDSAPTKIKLTANLAIFTGGMGNGQTMVARTSGNNLFITMEGTEIELGYFESNEFRMTFQIINEGSYILYKK